MQVNASATRNSGPIVNALLHHKILSPLMKSGLEIASGTGQHVVELAKAMNTIHWQPTEYDTSMFESIMAYTSEKKLNDSIAAPLELDTRNENHWENILKSNIVSSSTYYDIAFCVNMVHISPWECTIGLIKGASKVLQHNGKLVLYGPFRFHGSLTPESNVEFDKSLKERNSEWGIRDVDDITSLVNEYFYSRNNAAATPQVIEMPANNYILVYNV